MKRNAFALIFFLAVLSLVFSFDVKDGLMRIRVEELNGRVTLYRLITVTGSQYEALIFDTDARTSSLTISVDGRRIKLGDTQEYKIGTRRIEHGAEIVYTSPAIVVVQRIEFVRSTDSRVYNGFHVSYEVRNVLQRDSKISLRQIWDTRLGEKSGVHFSTGAVPRIEEEMTFTAEKMPPFIVTPGESVSFALLLEGVMRPDAVTLANWKRLSDSAWEYATPMRGFSQAPYSMNDSALGLFWNDTIVKAGASVTFHSYFLSGGSGVEFTRTLKDSGFQIAGQIEAPTPVRKELPLLEIDDILLLLQSLDSAIYSIDAVTDREIEDILLRLQDLRSREAQQ